MRKFVKESAAPEDTGAVRDKSGNGWLRNHWCALSICVIVVVAFLLRTVFAYGISADGDFALSGGSSAQYHLHVIESILNGSWSMTDSAVNYPVGGLNIYPPLMDFLAAGVASVLTATGMGASEAASAALASMAPVIGALTCIPVYLVGKEMFDKRVGVVGALIFAFLALPISTTVFSNGNEYGLAAFLLAFMSYFAVKMVKAADSDDASKKSVMVNALVAGIFLALAALTWNGFAVIVTILVVAMVIQIVADRLRGRDFSVVLAGYAAMILVGVLIPAAYYIPAGLWDAVFSGPFLTAVIAVVLSYVFLAVRSKPWVVTIPALVVVFAAVMVVLFFAAPELCSAILTGNSYYTSIMEELVGSYVSMSNVSAYYGWLTMWLPVCYAIYSLYVYLRKDRSATRLFITAWMFGLFFAVWTSYANAAVVGIVFAIGSAVVIVRVLEHADLRDWVNTMKVAGFPGLFRKMIKPLPFVSVLVVALLVVVPSVSYAVDAGIPSNSDADYYFTGNTNFTIKTGDSYPIGDLWESVDDMPKDGALVTWIDYVYDAVAQGGFETVADTIGGGASATAHIYLSDGAGGSVAAMILRIMMSEDKDFSGAFTNQDVYNAVKGFIDDPSSAVAEINANPSVYGNIRTDITDENAVYLASINAMLEGMSTQSIMETYDRVCDISGDSITYVLVDGSMLPLQYGDGGYFSTIAYFADYSVDGNGASTEFFSYNYYGQTLYTDAIYDTFLWKAMIGPSASEAGYSSSYSYLVALSSSDGSAGSAKAYPGYGLAGYEVAYWYVMFNSDPNASVSDDGWEYMSYADAIAEQKANGGAINYLSSVVLLHYTGVPSEAGTVSGTVSSGSSPVDGAKVSVYTYDSDFGGYVLYSEDTTRDGAYSVMVPSGDYRISVSVGGLELVNVPSGSGSDIDLGSASVSGSVQVNDSVYSEEGMMLELTGDAFSGKFQVVDGVISISSIIPGTYTYTLYGATGTSLGTGTVTFYPGSNDGVEIVPTTKTITATVNDSNGNPVDGGVVIATNISTGAQFSSEVVDGKATIAVISGKYTLSMGEGYVSVYSSTVTATSNKTATITAYAGETVTVSGVPSGVLLSASAGAFSTVSYQMDGQTRFTIPTGLGTDNILYSIYGVSGNTVYTGYYDGEKVSVSSSTAVQVIGTLKDGDDGEEGTIIFIGSKGESYTFVTDSEGKFDVLMPAGTYTILANNGSNKAYIGEVDVKGDIGDIDLVDGRKITGTLKYERGTSSSSTANLPFVMTVLSFTYEDNSYALYSMTNTSGVVNYYIPDDFECVLGYNTADGKLDNDCFSCTDLTRDISSSSSNSSGTTTIRVYDAEDEDEENIVKTLDVNILYTMTVHFYEDDDDVETTYEAGTKATLRPGQYDVTIEGSTGYYYKGTAYIYAGDAQFYGLDVEEVVTVNITKGTNDVVTIESEGSYHHFEGGYYLEKGYEYYFTSVNSTGTDRLIAYGYLDLTSATGSKSLDMTASNKEISVTGSVGIAADGEITVDHNGVLRTFDITDGAFTLTLPADWTSVSASADVSRDIDGETFYYSATGTFSSLKDGSIRNLAVTSTDAPESEDEPGFSAEITGSSFVDGHGTVTVSITNNTDAAVTYVLTAGSAWSLDRVVLQTVAAGATVSVNVTGSYDVNNVAPGHDGFDVIVSDINGSESQTLQVTGGAPSTDNSAVGVYRPGDNRVAYNDKVSASEYMYALTFVNTDTASKEITFNIPSISGWTITIMDEDGCLIGGTGDTYTVYGKQTTVFYVKYMQNASESDSEPVSVPSASITVTVGGHSSTISLEPTDAVIEAGDMDASGDNIFNQRSGIPSGIWFLVAVIILMVVAVFWLASKRGVFSR